MGQHDHHVEGMANLDWRGTERENFCNSVFFCSWKLAMGAHTHVDISRLASIADRTATVLLLAVHAGLLVWGLVGLAEMILAVPPWVPISNPLFSNAMLLSQWLLIIGAATSFLVGYARRWRMLPATMIALYTLMGALCAWQTFFILENATRFALMALEYAEYTAIAVYLSLSPHIRHHLQTR